MRRTYGNTKWGAPNASDLQQSSIRVLMNQGDLKAHESQVHNQIHDDETEAECGPVATKKESQAEQEFTRENE